MEPSSSPWSATRPSAFALARHVAAQNCACRPDTFLLDDITIVEAALNPGRMPFHLGRPHLGLATFGAGSDYKQKDAEGVGQLSS